MLNRYDGQPQVISPGSNVVGAFDPATGAEIWRCTYDGYSVVPRPVYGHGLLFIGTGFDRATAIAVRPGGTGDVTKTHLAWTTTKRAPHTPSMLVVGDELYMVSDSGFASCVDARSGEQHWQQKICGSVSASPVYAAGRIYFQDEAGKCTVIKAGRKFEKLAENDIGERSLASFAVDEGVIYLRTEKHLFRIEGK